MEEFEIKQKNTVTFVFISDTHNRLNEMKVPGGDVLIHAGDFTLDGKPDQASLFVKDIASLPHKTQIVIAGNHDLIFDDEYYAIQQNRDRYHQGQNYETKNLKHQLQSVCTYLENEMIEVYGYKIYGSPVTEKFFGWCYCGTGFRLIFQRSYYEKSSNDI